MNPVRSPRRDFPARNRFVHLGPAHDLVPRYSQNVVTEINVKRIRLVRNHFARHPLPVFQNHDFKFRCFERENAAKQKHIINAGKRKQRTSNTIPPLRDTQTTSPSE